MAGPILTVPLDVPSLGLPEGEKDAGQRVDFKPSKFDLLIETKGYLLAWTRASVCPCTPVTEQTEQPDPNCSLCGGTGWFYFGGNQVQDISEYDLDTIQKKIVNDSSAMLIRGVISNVMNKYDTLDKLGNWQSGDMQLTTKQQNKVGLYDRIVVLNPNITYSEVVVADGSAVLDARYLMTGINQVWGHASGSDPVKYTPGDDYDLNSIGQLAWLGGNEPSADTRIALHYICHPTFLIMEQPHVLRATLKKFKKSPNELQTPLGDPEPLPIQAIVRYEFLRRSG